MIPAYLVLLRVGFTMRRPLLAARCALTAPFHPYLRRFARTGLRRTVRSGAVYSLLHWPSSRLEAAVPDVIRHTALRSSDFPPPADTCAPPAAIIQPPAGSILPLSLCLTRYPPPIPKVCKVRRNKDLSPDLGFGFWQSTSNKEVTGPISVKYVGIRT